MDSAHTEKSGIKSTVYLHVTLKENTFKSTPKLVFVAYYLTLK